jgi:hypothetical protein
MRESSSVPAALDAIASCFEGIVPATICSCAADGTPNVTYLSIVHRLDEWHVGLSYQFFNKTRTNVLENPMVQVIVVSPETGDQYRLDLQYERTDVEGAVFDRMSTRLAAVASQTGMSQIFTLRGVGRLSRARLSSGAVRKFRHRPRTVHQYLPRVESLTEQLACMPRSRLAPRDGAHESGTRCSGTHTRSSWSLTKRASASIRSRAAVTTRPALARRSGSATGCSVSPRSGARSCAPPA